MGHEGFKPDVAKAPMTERTFIDTAAHVDNRWSPEIEGFIRATNDQCGAFTTCYTSVNSPERGLAFYDDQEY